MKALILFLALINWLIATLYYGIHTTYKKIIKHIYLLKYRSLAIKSTYIIIAILFSVKVFSQKNYRDFNSKESVAEKWLVEFDENILRIPGKKIPIEISKPLKNGEKKQTNGILRKKLHWNKLEIEVKGGIFRNGKIYIDDTNSYLKGKALLIKVYHQKSSKLLFTQQIPYNYETKIKLFTNNPLGKIPENTVKYGVRNYYDNGYYEDLLPKKSVKYSCHFFSRY